MYGLKINYRLNKRKKDMRAQVVTLELLKGCWISQ